ncbi:glycoside hydrolase family 140 protein [Echinicola marina]|uniref:glycoside hydrolase family 140 protein n=1 Tax=Echinicola marina TaxID=2859768 RepID=UPI001CF69276|nr:glycoside hydrolase family 140 protein [Echinicola marina]UCS92722.1 glycoside hydrolase family 140 protein [Echinicola marina]
MKKTFLIVLFGLLSLYVKGQTPQLLRISENKKHIVNQDNEPFFWLGGTAWEMIHRLNKEEIDLYLTDRASKGFTIIQTVILAELDGLNTPNAYGHKPLIDNNPEKINEKYFELVDYVINKASELGMYIGLLPSWGDKFNLKWGPGPVIFTPENAEKYGELLAKRYLDKTNIIWVLGGDRMPENDYQYNIVMAMAKGIRKIDSLHLMTYHPAGAYKATDSFNVEWLDFDMFQSGHDRSAKEYNYVLKSHQVSPPRPVIEAEARYENIMEKFWEPGEHAWMDDADVRLTAYWTMLSGAAGYTYGCHDIWQMYTIGAEPISKARTGWKEALQLPGSRQMSYMKEILTSFPWQNMVNNQTLILNDNPEDQGYIVSAIGQDNDFIIAYTPMGRAIQLYLSKIHSNKIKAFWYNPRSGESVLINTYSTTEKPIFKPWATGRGSDFLLIILDINSAIQIP